MRVVIITEIKIRIWKVDETFHWYVQILNIVEELKYMNVYCIQQTVLSTKHAKTFINNVKCSFKNI